MSTLGSTEHGIERVDVRCVRRARAVEHSGCPFCRWGAFVTVTVTLLLYAGWQAGKQAFVVSSTSMYSVLMEGVTVKVTEPWLSVLAVP
jgi:hypothetical protein